jgi:hypothetical protein
VSSLPACAAPAVRKAPWTRTLKSLATPTPGTPAIDGLNPDFSEILAALESEGASFLVIGAHALAVHGVPRATGDLDLWVRPDPENAHRVWRALVRFGAPVEAMAITPADFARPGLVYQIGLPPRRIDVLTEISGLGFDEAWTSRVVQRVGDLEVPFLGREALLKNKRASGRTKDLADLEALDSLSAR